MSKKKSSRALRSTQKLMGIERIKDTCLATPANDVYFFRIRPSNLSVMPEDHIEDRIRALSHVITAEEGVELLALDARESFESNKLFYTERMEKEPLPKLKELLQKDIEHLDNIQIHMAACREFYIMVRLRGNERNSPSAFLSRIIQRIQSNGFSVKQANGQDIKRMLAVYYEQNVTNDHFPDLDGEQYGQEA